MVLSSNDSHGQTEREKRAVPSRSWRRVESKRLTLRMRAGSGKLLDLARWPSVDLIHVYGIAGGGI